MRKQGKQGKAHRWSVIASVGKGRSCAERGPIELFVIDFVETGKLID